MLETIAATSAGDWARFCSFAAATPVAQSDGDEHLLTLAEDEVQARLHLFIRIKDDGPAPVVSKSSGQRQAQCAACRKPCGAGR